MHNKNDFMHGQIVDINMIIKRKVSFNGEIFNSKIHILHVRYTAAKYKELLCFEIVTTKEFLGKSCRKSLDALT